MLGQHCSDRRAPAVHIFNIFMEYVKRVIDKGIGIRRPTDLARVVVHVLGISISSDGAKAEFDRRDSLEITIGEACDELSETLETCICTMVVGEKCEMELRCVEVLPTTNGIPVLRKGAQQSTILYTVHLVTLEDGPDIWELDPSAKLQRAQHFKELGGVRYKEERFASAAVLYAKGLRYVISIAPADREREDIKVVRSAMLLNLSACQLKLGYHDAVVKNCSKVLEVDPHCVKALYRRGLARTNTNDLDLASEDLRKAQQLSPGDQGIKEQIGILNAKIRARNARLGASLKRMFY